MRDNLDIFVILLEKVGVAALVVLAYRMIRQSHKSLLWSGPAIGMLFSIGILITMIDPIVVAPGVILDIRSVLIGLAALFGGIWAALIASIVTIAGRIYIGGDGALAGAVGIVISAVIGLSYARISGNRRDVRGLAVLGFLLSINLITILLLPLKGQEFFTVGSISTLVMRNLFGTIILGSVLAMEDRHESEFRTFKSQAELDALTGLSNRRVLDMWEMQKQGHRGGEIFSVIMLDIDHFKRLNDSYGHEAGDRVLARLAEIIATRMRNDDLVVRYGGEEFCIVVERSRADNAAKIAEEIRQHVAEERFKVKKTEISVTFSAGVAESSAHVTSVFSVLKQADEALYKAKEEGRNRVCLYQPEDDLISTPV